MEPIEGQQRGDSNLASTPQSSVVLIGNLSSELMSDLLGLKKFTSAPLWGSEIQHNDTLVIAGPCSAESREQVLQTARALSQKGVKIFRAGIWKPRTYPNQFEGVGEKGLPWLTKVQQETGMLVGTEVGTALHAELALKHHLDFVWIGARTASTPFIVQEIADVLKGSDLPVLIKNPLSPSLDLWQGATLRLIDAGITKVGLVHRGFDIGIPSALRNAPLWEVIAELRDSAPGLPIYLDPSHIAGNRAYLGRLIQIANVLQYDGIMIESHLTPDKALSDRNQQITPDQLAKTLEANRHATPSNLQLLRDELGWLDDRLLLLLDLRRKLSQQLGEVKRKEGFAPFQEEQYLARLDKITHIAKAYDIPAGLVKELYRTIHNDSVKIQSQPTSGEKEYKLKSENHCITLAGLRFFGYHGLLEHEKRVGNTFEVTLQLYFPADQVMESGDLSKGINYAEVYQVVEEEMAIPTELLEGLTQRILERLHEEFLLLTAATLSITKLAPPIGGFDGKGITFSASAAY